MKRIAVIGAGPAGCSAAYHLKKQGYEVTVLEKESHLGGRTRTYRHDGFNLDTGAAFFTNFYPRVLKLLKTLGLKDKISPLKRVNALADQGQLAELNISSLPSFLKFPLVSRVDKAKMLSWVVQTTFKRLSLDLVQPHTLLKYDHQSVAQYAAEHLTDEIYHYFVRPGIEPFWYFSCEEISASLVMALTSRAAGAKFYRLHNGIDQLCTALTSEVSLVCGAQVQKIHIREEGYQIDYLSDQQTKSLQVDRVVVATTAQYAAHLVQGFPHTQVSEKQSAFLTSQKYVPHIHATFRLASDYSFPQYSSIFPCGQGQHSWAAISFHKEKNHQEDQLISVYLSAQTSHDFIQAQTATNQTATNQTATNQTEANETQMDDAQIYAYCQEVVGQFHPELSAVMTPFHVIKRTHAIPIHEVGRYELATQFQEEQKEKGILFCGDYLSTATIEGAVYSGMCVSEHLQAQSF